jgi:hypothetical protein
LFNIVVSPKLHCADKLGDRRPTCRTPLNLRLENKHPGYKIVCIEKSVREGQKPSSAVPEEHHDRRRIEVLTKTKIAFAAALILGTASAALAGGNSGEYSGGSDIGPLGQCFSPPDCGGRSDASGAHNGNSGKAYGFVAREKHKHRSPR